MNAAEEPAVGRDDQPSFADLLGHSYAARAIDLVVQALDVADNFAADWSKPGALSGTKPA